jgi:DNA repair protein RadC
VGRSAAAFASKEKIMQQNFFFESEPNQTGESSSHWSSVGEKLERYGSSALSTNEHLTLLVGKEAIARDLLQHFGSLKNLSRATLPELTPFLSKTKAHTLIAALSVSSRATVEEAATEKMDNPETVYRSCLDMQQLQQEVLRVVLLDTRFRRITTVNISKGTLNESLAHPREIFRPAIVHAAYAFVLVHNHPSGDPAPSEADLRLTKRIDEAAKLLQIRLLDHVIVGQGNPGHFSFKAAGLI